MTNTTSMVVLFKDITTDGVIASIEKNSKTYHEGFYGDMNNAGQRKGIKESASEIGGIIKELETARIKITKDHTSAVNKEHKSIVDRLKVANEPFTILIDAYAVERKKILDAEKARKAAIILAEQQENDHDYALLMNAKFDSDIIAVERERIDYEAKLKAGATEAERLAGIERQRVAQQKIDDAETARVADVNHTRTINRAIFKGFVDAGLDNDSAKIATQALIDSKIPHTQINY